MENDLKYQVRSREIIDLANAMRNQSLILSPYFQRNLVWRDTHKRDFIDTILQGYPFPQIFLARGPIDVDTMAASTCVVDGQQRLTAIWEFLSGKLDVNGKFFSELEKSQKETFFKYEVPVIDFDLEADDPRLKEIFKRLNRTFYALSTIEKIASEYSSSKFLLTARVLSGDFSNDASDEFELEQDLLPDLALAEVGKEENAFLVDPSVDQATLGWLNEKADGKFSAIIGNGSVFSYYEVQRKVPLMFVLNLLSTLEYGFYNRNAKVKDALEEFNEDFEHAEGYIDRLNVFADFIEAMNLEQNSIWWNKAVFFSLIVEGVKNADALLDPVQAKHNLDTFAADIPNDFALAAREAVNNRNPRLVRSNYIAPLLTGIEIAEAAQAAAVGVADEIAAEAGGDAAGANENG